MNAILLLALIGLIYRRADAIQCYTCADCSTATSLVLDCSTFSSTDSCYLTKAISTGQINKSCGSPSLDGLGLSLGCTMEGDFIACRCNTDLCNTDDLPSSTTVPAPTVASPSAPWYCHVCVQCGSSTGELFNCAAFSNSRTCYYSRDPAGEVTRSCGTSQLDQHNLANGCVEASGYKNCKCSESGCNAYPEFTSPNRTISTTLTPPTTTLTALPTTILATAIEIISTTAANSSNVTIFPASRNSSPNSQTTAMTRRPTTSLTTASSSSRSESFFCYLCVDCDSSGGTVVNCTTISSSTSCYLLKEASGSVTRSCGRELDALNIELGCNTNSNGATLCRCEGSYCNRYPEITSTESETSPWHCYFCSNCTDSPGVLLDCSQSTKARACVLLQDDEGTIFRSCSTDGFADLALADGCGTYDGSQVCQCSENACNEYPEFFVTTRSPTEVVSTGSSQSNFYCHFCLDCGNTVGRLIECPSNSCALTIEDGRYSRLCGSTAIDITVPEPRGCRKVDQTEICKCSTSECNTYYVKTGISPNSRRDQTTMFNDVLFSTFSFETSTDSCDKLTSSLMLTATFVAVFVIF